jgi:hypothetical protein
VVIRPRQRKRRPQLGRTRASNFLFFPADTPENSVAQAMALFRWDADEDRDLKDTYAALKATKGNPSWPQESFC